MFYIYDLIRLNLREYVCSEILFLNYFITVAISLAICLLIPESMLLYVGAHDRQNHSMKMNAWIDLENWKDP